MSETISNDIECCPHCGSEEYYIKQHFKGNTQYIMRFDGKEADNTDLHMSAIYTNTSKYAWCKQCNKRLFRIDD